MLPFCLRPFVAIAGELHLCNMKINDIKHKYCLNLEHRTDRRAHAIAQFEKHKIEGVEFVNAVDGAANKYSSIYLHITPGAIGCYHSHLQILKNAYHAGINEFIVFEDDVEFSGGFDMFIESQLTAVPDDWNFIYLGWADFKGFEDAMKTSINEWVCKPLNPYGLFGYVVRGGQFMAELIKFFEARINDIQRQYDEYLGDEYWPNTHYKMYALIPPLVHYASMGTNIQNFKRSSSK